MQFLTLRISFQAQMYGEIILHYFSIILWTDQHNVRLYTVKQSVENGWRYDILISVYSNKISPTMILMIVNVIWPTRMYCELVYTSLTIIFFYNIKMICTIITLYIGLCIKTLLYTTFNQINNYFEYLLWGNAILFVTNFSSLLKRSEMKTTYCVLLTILNQNQWQNWYVQIIKTFTTKIILFADASLWLHLVCWSTTTTQWWNEKKNLRRCMFCRISGIL